MLFRKSTRLQRSFIGTGFIGNHERLLTGNVKTGGAGRDRMISDDMV